MRGARAPPPRPPPSRGIIPAGAGSTSSRRSRTSRPRGSSPQVRGAHPPGAPVVAQGGIIPAGAGSTSARRASRTAPWDHPRRCGEHSILPASLSDAPCVYIHFYLPEASKTPRQTIIANGTCAPSGTSPHCSTLSEASPSVWHRPCQPGA